MKDFGCEMNQQGFKETEKEGRMYEGRRRSKIKRSKAQTDLGKLNFLKKFGFVLELILANEPLKMLLTSKAVKSEQNMKIVALLPRFCQKP